MTASRTSLRITLAGLVVALAGATAVTAFAHGPGRGDMAGGPFMGRMSERMLDSVDATAEQRAQIRQITEAARADLRAQRDGRRALHEQAMDLFKQPTVDANAAEALRQQMLQQHDQASRRMLQAMLDVSRVLTPEQRARLAERAAQRRDMMKRHWQERQDLQPRAPREGRTQ
jgi:Spy/CpxP family protein refolding chaperone